MRPSPAKLLLLACLALLAPAPYVVGSNPAAGLRDGATAATGAGPRILASNLKVMKSDPAQGSAAGGEVDGKAGAASGLSARVHESDGPSHGAQPSTSDGLVVLRTVYSTDLPAGFVRTTRTVQTIPSGSGVITRTIITRTMRPYRRISGTWIDIPSLHLQHRVVEGISQSDMARGPGHFPGMALPGEVGNCGIAAHSNVPGCAYFRYLNRLRPGAPICLHTPSGVYTYNVVTSHIVSPSNVRDLRPTDYRRLTLVTCALPDARNRLIVVAVPAADLADYEYDPGEPVRQVMPVTGRTRRRPNERRSHSPAAHRPASRHVASARRSITRRVVTRTTYTVGRQSTR